MTKSTNNQDLLGAVFLEKVPGETSFQALNRLKKLLGPKIGHTGTLDKFADGLLVVMVGKLTRFASLVTGMDKVYEAEFTFGEQTATLDPEGEVIKTAAVPSEQTLRETIGQFIGPIMQSPPEYSAVHINGKRAYERALAGEEVSMTPRPITIFSFQIISVKLPQVLVRIHCSKGTYIRSLARDWALASSSVATVTKLKRLTVGPFGLDEAVKATDFDPQKDLLSAEDFLHRLKFPILITEQTEYIRQGKPLSAIWKLEELDGDGPWAVFNPQDEFIAVIRCEDGQLKYQFVV